MLVDYVEKEKAAALTVSFRNVFHASDNDLQHADPSPLISLPPTPPHMLSVITSAPKIHAA